MEYILVTVQSHSESQDMKIPAAIKAGDLLNALCEIFKVGGESLHAEPKGIILDKRKTLEEQGVFHGAKLTIS